MPVRIKITVLFTLVVFFILGIVCLSIYYFSSTARDEAIETRLMNRAITTARLLSRSEFFDRKSVERIDSLTTLSLVEKSVQAYNYSGKKIYYYSDLANDSIPVTADLLQETKMKERVYFLYKGKDVVSYHYTDNNTQIVILCAAKDEQGQKNLAQLKNILTLTCISGLAIAFIGGYFFSKRLLSPVRKITREVTDISAYSLTRRLDPGRVKDEWFELTITLNDLLNRLQESFELQRRFISNASHELSTPLTSIMSQVEIALLKERNDEEYKTVLNSVLQDVKEMTKLTHTLLELSKGSGNKGGIEINLVRVDEILLEMPAIMQKQNESYIVFLNFGPLPENEEDLLVFGNSELLTTAIKNIVWNACKYSGDHRAILSFFVKEGHFLIQVSDRGEGIAVEEITKVFQPFYRSIDINDEVSGFGLGLPLAHRIIKLHKGNITVQTELKKGTSFLISLPTAKNHVPQTS